ncbi:MAG: RAMP superfamily CRISPR-associated protein [Desulfosporosinus sp.]|nr:RAMP superfamily CRISPR-associated protein [Desulfosporosinus sp.]
MINVEGFLPVRWDIVSAVLKVESQKNYEPHLAMQNNERRANDGSFYAYNVLPAGSLYYGEIYAHDPDHLGQILQLMEKENGGYESELLIGKGITRGYGRVKLHLETITESKLNPETIETRVKSLDKLFLEIHLQTVTQLHVGSGDNDGLVDNQLFRRVDGKLIIPGSSLAGVLRSRATMLFSSLFNLINV